MDKDNKLIMEALMKNPAPQIGIQHGLDRIMEELVNLIEAVKPLKSVSIKKSVLSDINELQRGLKLLEGLLMERMYAEDEEALPPPPEEIRPILKTASVPPPPKEPGDGRPYLSAA